MKADNRKNLKIDPVVHKELSVFVALNDKESMGDFASTAIADKLRQRGHKFVSPEKKSKK